MNIFKKLFGIKSEKTEEQIRINERGKYMPEIKLPADERFTINFNANGGKFLYCENMEEVLSSFQNILLENDWQEKPAMILDDRLAKMFKTLELSHSKSAVESTYFLSSC